MTLWWHKAFGSIGPSNGANRVLSMRAHPSPDLQFNVILSFSNETSVFFATSSTLKSIILSPTTPKVAKALKGFLQLAISKLPIMTLTNDFVRVMMVAVLSDERCYLFHYWDLRWFFFCCPPIATVWRTQNLYHNNHPCHKDVMMTEQALKIPSGQRSPCRSSRWAGRCPSRHFRS